MRISDLITAVRAEVNDTDSQFWTDVQIARWMNLHVRSIFRQRASADVSYSAQRISITGNDATRVRQIQQNTFAYYLPTWAWRVRQVRETKPVGDTTGRILLNILHTRAGAGWRFEGNGRIDIVGFERTDLDFWVAKTPSLIHKGTVRKTSGDTSTIYLDHLHSYVEDREAGAYLGARIEATGIATAGRDPRGTVGEVIATATEWDTTLSAYLVKLTVMPGFPVPLTATDTYEMHAEVDDAHSMYLVLLTARSLMQEHANTERLKQIELAVERQRVDFIDGIRQRQDLVPPIISDPYGGPGWWDPDRDMNMQDWGL